MAIVKRKQDPADKLDYGFDYNDPQATGGPFLQAGETISTSTWTLHDDSWAAVADVAVGGDSIVGGSKTAVFLGPATDVVAIRDSVRFLTNHIVTSQGREKDQSYQFTLEEQ